MSVQPDRVNALTSLCRHGSESRSGSVRNPSQLLKHYLVTSLSRILINKYFTKTV